MRRSRFAKNDKVAITIRVPSDLGKALRERAEKNCRALAREVELILRESLKSNAPPA